MSNLARFNPFSDMMEPFNDDFFKSLALRPVFRLTEGEPQMRLDLTEDDKNFFVKAEIPGVKKEDIKVQIDGDQVSISAETRVEREAKDGERVLHSERYYGKVARTFTLGAELDDARVVAKFENGVLELTLPRKQSVAAKQITIQ